MVINQYKAVLLTLSYYTKLEQLWKENGIVTSAITKIILLIFTWICVHLKYYIHVGTILPHYDTYLSRHTWQIVHHQWFGRLQSSWVCLLGGIYPIPYQLGHMAWTLTSHWISMSLLQIRHSERKSLFIGLKNILHIGYETR